MQTNKDKHGLLMIYTGNGKGKTTAALGQMLRAWGWNMRVVMFQFIKDTGLSTGEHRAAQKMNLNIRPLGTGFTWNIKDKDRAETIALEQWNRCQEAMSSGQFDMIIMDEVSYALNNSWIPLSQVVDTIRQRPPELHIVLTGRNMPPQLIEIANLVTEMKEIKHPYSGGIKAQKGIEY